MDEKLLEELAEVSQVFSKETLLKFYQLPAETRVRRYMDIAAFGDVLMNTLIAFQRKTISLEQKNELEGLIYQLVDGVAADDDVYEGLIKKTDELCTQMFPKLGKKTQGELRKMN